VCAARHKHCLIGCYFTCSSKRCTSAVAIKAELLITCGSVSSFVVQNLDVGSYGLLLIASRLMCSTSSYLSVCAAHINCLIIRVPATICMCAWLELCYTRLYLFRSFVGCLLGQGLDAPPIGAVGCCCYFMYANWGLVLQTLLSLQADRTQCGCICGKLQHRDPRNV
jgi:hypothetical protein